jgi:hypothetical protein
MFMTKRQEFVHYVRHSGTRPVCSPLEILTATVGRKHMVAAMADTVAEFRC